MKARRASIAILATLLSALPSAGAQEASERVIVDVPSERDLYLTGDEVEVRAPVTGDLVAAGRDVRVSANVSGDAVLAGGSVVVESAVGDDVRAAGNTVRIAGPIAGHLVAAGQTVVVEAGQQVVDWAWLAGERVEVLGNVGSLRVAGQDVTIAGEVRGDAHVVGDTIRLAPGTVVRGDLTWSSEHELDVGAGVIVEGRTLREPVPAAGEGATAIAVIFWLTSLIFAVLLLELALPAWSATMAQTARDSTWKSLAVGVAVLVLTPFVIGLAFLSGVLWIVGLLLLVAYVLALCAGGLLGVIAVADLGIEIVLRDATPSRGRRLAAAAITALVVGLVALIPVLGGLVLLLLTVIGLGASALTLRRARRRPAELVIETEGEPAPA